MWRTHGSVPSQPIRPFRSPGSMRVRDPDLYGGMGERRRAHQSGAPAPGILPDVTPAGREAPPVDYDLAPVSRRVLRSLRRHMGRTLDPSGRLADRLHDRHNRALRGRRPNAPKNSLARFG